MKIYFIILSILSMIFSSALAQADSSYQFNSQEWRRLKQIENYLNDIDRYQADFTQYSSDGQVESGQLYMERPEKMRVEYHPPSPTLLVANHGSFVVIDNQLKQSNSYPLSQTPLAWLLQKPFQFDRPDLVISDYIEKDGQIQIELISDENDVEGALRLIFHSNPIEFRQWQIKDAMGNNTIVTLSGGRINPLLSDDLFDIPRFKQDNSN